MYFTPVHGEASHELHRTKKDMDSLRAGLSHVIKLFWVGLPISKNRLAKVRSDKMEYKG